LDCAHVLVALLALASLLCVSHESDGSNATAFAAPSFQQTKQVIAPVSALVLGLILYNGAETRTAGQLLIYFGAQTGMNLYMKGVLSKPVISEELNMVGVPAAFLVTGLQQIVAFGIFLVVTALSWLTPYGYTPKKLKTKQEYMAVCCFAFFFAFNIGLNNFSLSLLPISLNLIIRSCLPLSTAVSQNILGSLGLSKASSVTPKQFAIMLTGVFCAGLATVAKAKGSSGGSKESSDLMLGVTVGTLSIFAGAVNFVLAGYLGEAVKMNPVDTTCYMAVPAALFLCVPIFLLPHPVRWPGYDMMTDWQVFLKIWELSPATVGWLVLSGAFAISYNVLQYALVQSLSATYTAFAGNMNKAATVALALLTGMESLPEGQWGLLMFVGIAGNIASFTYYSMVKGKK